MVAVSLRWQPLALGLAAALYCQSPALAQSPPLAERIVQCAGCHGEDGNSRMENIPSLAGQPEFFLMNQLFLMREGVRQIEAMMPFVKDLKDDEMHALAAHYAKLEPRRGDEKVDTALAARGEQLATQRRCGSCHKPDLGGDQQMPRLAKQRSDYLTHALKGYRDSTRTGADTLMSASVAGLPDADLAALAHFAASR